LGLSELTELINYFTQFNSRFFSVQQLLPVCSGGITCFGFEDRQARISWLAASPKLGLGNNSLVKRPVYKLAWFGLVFYPSISTVVRLRCPVDKVPFSVSWAMLCSLLFLWALHLNTCSLFSYLSVVRDQLTA
jgi:hypothetical protein